MAGIFELIDPKLLGQPTAPVEQEGQFSRGMRSGALGLGAGFSNAAGAIGGSLGFPEFSKGAYATADDLGQQAAAAAPRITSSATSARRAGRAASATPVTSSPARWAALSRARRWASVQGWPRPWSG